MCKIKVSLYCKPNIEANYPAIVQTILKTTNLDTCNAELYTARLLQNRSIPKPIEIRASEVDRTIDQLVSYDLSVEE